MADRRTLGPVMVRSIESELRDCWILHLLSTRRARGLYTHRDQLLSIDSLAARILSAVGPSDIGYISTSIINHSRCDAIPYLSDCAPSSRSLPYQVYIRTCPIPGAYQRVIYGTGGPISTQTGAVLNLKPKYLVRSTALVLSTRPN